MKVLLVDDHPLILSALQSVIEGMGDGVSVLGVEDADSARATLRADDSFDLVLLDLALGDDDGFALLAELRTTWPAIPVVVVSASERTSDVVQALDLGAMGFVPKRTGNEPLVQALSTIMQGGMYVPPSMLGLDKPLAVDSGTSVPEVMRLLEENAKPEPHQSHQRTLESIGLTPRQTDVLALLLQGLPNKLIARKLNVSVETVKDHVAAVLRALNVSTRTQAVLAVSQMTQGQAVFNVTRPGPR